MFFQDNDMMLDVQQIIVLREVNFKISARSLAIIVSFDVMIFK